MKRIGEASAAVAEAVKLCRVGVIGLFPITPQTHIVERLTEIVNNGELKAEVIRADSEHSMISTLIGSYLVGVRSFAATSSQGLALANEVLHIIAGMRIPAVIAIVSRALSAPINIWGDHSDVMNCRDCSWMQFHCKNTQAAFDSIIQAYAIAEKVKLPAMVILDGFTLSHTFEPIDLLTQEEVDSFLPQLKMEHILDPKNPKTFGPVGFPKDYMEFKKQQMIAMMEAKQVIKEVNLKFSKMFGRSYGDGLIEVFNENKDKVIIASGTVAQTARELECCVIHLRSFRPFPYSEIKKVCNGKKDVLVIDRAYSYGSGGPLAIEVRNVIPNARSAIMGLGGKDIRIQDIEKALRSKEKEIWI